MHGLFSSWGEPGLLSSCDVWALHWSGFSCGPRALGCSDFSSRSSQALEHWLNSCGTGAQLLGGMWDPPRLGIESMSPALVGGFFTTEPPGKPTLLNLKQNCIINILIFWWLYSVQMLSFLIPCIFILKIYLNLGDNCFTMLRWFLYDVNQLMVCHGFFVSIWNIGLYFLHCV